MASRHLRKHRMISRMDNYRWLFPFLIAVIAGCATVRQPTEIRYNIGPLQPGAFTAIDIVLDIQSLTYTTPHNDGYGVYRFDGTNICFLASYSDTERCIDYQVVYSQWRVGDEWAIKSFDGSDAVVTVMSIRPRP